MPSRLPHVGVLCDPLKEERRTRASSLRGSAPVALPPEGDSAARWPPSEVALRGSALGALLHTEGELAEMCSEVVGPAGCSGAEQETRRSDAKHGEDSDEDGDRRGAGAPLRLLVVATTELSLETSGKDGVSQRHWSLFRACTEQEPFVRTRGHPRWQTQSMGSRSPGLVEQRAPPNF